MLQNIHWYCLRFITKICITMFCYVKPQNPYKIFFLTYIMRCESMGVKGYNAVFFNLEFLANLWPLYFYNSALIKIHSEL